MQANIYNTTVRLATTQLRYAMAPLLLSTSFSSYIYSYDFQVVYGLVASGGCGYTSFCIELNFKHGQDEADTGSQTGRRPV